MKSEKTTKNTTHTHIENKIEKKKNETQNVKHTKNEKGKRQ